MRAFLLCFFFFVSAFGQELDKKTKKHLVQPLFKKHRFSIQGGSFIKHYLNTSVDYTEHFSNGAIVGTWVFNEEKRLFAILGTTKNSYGFRCGLAGVGKEWKQLSPRMTFVGMYAYAGEFPFEGFRDCGGRGSYNAMEKLIGVGFAPYLYHGVRYDVNSFLSFNAGIILPHIIAMNFEIRF